MKDLSLRQIEKDSAAKNYRVWLFKSNSQEFTRERDAKKFLVQVNRELTQCLYGFNEIYRQTVSHSQNFIFSLKVLKLKEYNEIKAAIDERIYFICYRYAGQANHFYFSTLLYIGSKISELISLIITEVNKIKYTNLEYTFQGLQIQLDQALFKLKQVGHINTQFNIGEFERQLKAVESLKIA